MQDKYVFENYFHTNPCFHTFLDVGAFDGKHLSNSLFFEKYLGWEGVCIEAHPENFQKLVFNRPKCINYNCAAFYETGSFISIVGGGTGAGIGKGNGFNVSTCRVDDILLQNNITEIDFFSLDAEDAEYYVLSGIDFSKIFIKIITIELAGRAKEKDEKVRNILRQNNFRFVTKIGDHLDEVWINNKIYSEIPYTKPELMCAGGKCCVCGWKPPFQQPLSSEIVRDIPSFLLPHFTLNGKIELGSYFIENEFPKPTEGIGWLNYSFAACSRARNIALSRRNNYYGNTDRDLYQALDKYPIKGKSVAIMGSAEPWYEAVCMTFGGDCTVIEYRHIQYDDPEFHQKIRTITVSEFWAMDPEKRPRFDAAISISSYEHDGLGRYGDPLNPYGDFEAMQQLRHCILKPGGIVYLAVMRGEPDTLFWNAHRSYGHIRLPMLMEGFKLLFGDTNLIPNHQPVFVLQAQ